MSSFLVDQMQQNPFTREENLNFFKNMFLALMFFLITPLTLGVSLFSLYSLRTSSVLSTKVVQNNQGSSGFSGVQVYASLPAKLPSVSGEVGSADARAEIVKKYLASYNSPLTPFAEILIETADKYGLDYRLLPAIAQQESNLCKIIPAGTYNCWGWGIHSQGTLGFNSFNEGIEIVAKGLRTQYLDKGFATIPEIMSKYTPVSPEGAWAKGVTQFMSEME